MKFVLTYKEKTQRKYNVFKQIKEFAKKKSLEAELSSEFKVEFIKLMCIFEKHLVYNELLYGSYPAF